MRHSRALLLHGLRSYTRGQHALPPRARVHTSGVETIRAATTVTDLYYGRVERGEIVEDPQQTKVVSVLERLNDDLRNQQKRIDMYWPVLKEHKSLLENWYVEKEQVKDAVRERDGTLMEKLYSRLRGFAIARSSEGKSRRQLAAEAAIGERQEDDGADGRIVPVLENPKYNHNITMEQYEEALDTWQKEHKQYQAKYGKWLKGDQSMKECKADDLISPPPPLPPPPHATPRGVFICGEVGTGKSMMMDMLFEATSDRVGNRRRVHHHAFMLSLHEEMHKYQTMTAKERSKQGLDSCIIAAAASILKSVDGEGLALVCFDEFQVNDVGDAIILQRLFDYLTRRGTVVVATSNKPPDELGNVMVSHEDMTSFVDLLKVMWEPVEIQSTLDYRRANIPQNLLHDISTYIVGTGPEAKERAYDEVKSLIGKKDSKLDVNLERVDVMFGRHLTVPSPSPGVATLAFKDICDQPVGASDYIALAKNYHTVLVTDIPVMNANSWNQARRFITLIDELYNHKSLLLAHAEAPIEDLFDGSHVVDWQLMRESLEFETEMTRKGVGAGNRFDAETFRSSSLFTSEQELFAFKRAISRLKEMRTERYLRSRDRAYK